MNNNTSVRVTPEMRLAQMGLELPRHPPAPIGTFHNVKRCGSMLYVSGQGPVLPDGRLMTGKVGRDVSVDEARDHARLVGLNILAAIKEEVGELSAVTDIVKLLGMVNAVSEFTDHPYVINGCSEMLCQVMGECGRHARSAIGVGSLPNNITVEIEAVVAIRG